MKKTALLSLWLLSYPALASASEASLSLIKDHPLAIWSLVLFIAGYTLVVFEEKLHMRKSKPVILAAGLIWIFVAIAYGQAGRPELAEESIRHNLLEYAELFLFLLVAMTYINALEKRNVFLALKSWMVSKGFSLKATFWLTGLLAFFISPVADNMTTALFMGTIAMTVGAGNMKFIALACINIVVAANAGGAFSPFGDITTLMVWQKGQVTFWEFFRLFLPSVVNWLVPASIMSFAIGNGMPKVSEEKTPMLLGAKRIIFLFIATIVTAVSFHNYLHLPPAAGMMLGYGYLGIFSWWLKLREKRMYADDTMILLDEGKEMPKEGFDILKKVAMAEWDTLFFFYGVILCVGGLAQFGYLAGVSHTLYEGLGATWANTMIGLLSAVVDNIPVMFAVLTMDPQMSHGQWLLVTLTAGVGGSLLSVGSAAGVALMGQARGYYTFASHLKWTWAVALGYVLSILTHLFINRAVM